VAWKPEASVCVVLASAGYPGAHETGRPITFLAGAGGIADVEALPGVQVFHAGTALRDGALVTAGGRVLGVQALGRDIRGAVDAAYAAVERIHFEGMHYRRDIAGRALRR
jgi:phosphoribosylamine--glycine ligase